MDKHIACEGRHLCATMTTTMRAGEMRAGETLETQSGKYVLDQLLGKGGMGAVWSAYHTESQQKFAVKVILPQLEEELTKELRKRLLREAGACAKLQHPNIIQVFEVGETDLGNTFMVLELLDGQPLGDVLKQKRRLEPKLAARIAADIASGLSEAHAAKVIHRDLKPANIFLHREPGMGEDEFVTKVLDFGVCIDREAMDTVKTRAGIAVGSPAYMSPEQVMMRKDLDARTDIWSLGLILYEMVTGMRVFSGNLQNVMAQIITQPVPAPSSKVRDVPPDLDAVVARCTQIKKELRYAEAGELARDLYVIAGVRQPVRQPSTSRPSIARTRTLPGLIDGYEQDIMATPAVPAPGGARTFNPAAATLPLIPPERRAEVDKLPLPPVMEEDEELAATLPMKSNHLAMLRPKPLEESKAAEAETAAGTQFLRMDEPVASPAPQWKQEMERALEVHRQSSHSLPVFDPETQAKLAEISQSINMAEVGDVVGGTQMLAPGTQMLAPGLQWARTEVPLPADSEGTTSMAGSMSQELRVGALLAEPAAPIRRKRRPNQLLYGAAAFLSVAVVFLFVAVVLKKVPKDLGSVTPMVNESATTVLPLPPITSDASSSAAPPDVPPPGQTETLPPVVAPSASAAPSAAAPQVSATAVTTAATNAPPATTNPPLINTGGSGGPKKGPGTLKKPPPPPPPAKETCKGTGVFRRCTKG